jgi:membrane-bound lytic murein transglycosylase B
MDTYRYRRGVFMYRGKVYAFFIIVLLIIGIIFLSVQNAEAEVDHTLFRQIVMKYVSANYVSYLWSIAHKETNHGINLGSYHVYRRLMYLVKYNSPTEEKLEYYNEQIRCLKLILKHYCQVDVRFYDGSELRIVKRPIRDLNDFVGSEQGAMGYMQIIPQTFYAFAQDGDGDGMRDPLNLYDSIATAARYFQYILAKHDWNVEDALFDYNHSSVYVSSVMTLALNVKIIIEKNVVTILWKKEQ